MATKNKAPRVRSVQIGGFVYAVEYIADLRDDDGKLDGRIHHGKTRIQLETALGDQALDQTLIHETLHAIFNQMGNLYLIKETELDALAHHLYQFIRDNPRLIRRILP